MNRDLQALTSREFDVVVIGGGIQGAALAREAALCGLSTALIEQNDFCSATSANSLKIIHGGLRYLQQLDVTRLRSSVVERRCLLRTAPHLVHPLPCIMPTQGHLMKGREAMFAGMLLNDILSADRNSLTDPEKSIPGGRLISRAEVCRLVPGLSPAGITGGAAWHDAYTHNSERLVTAMIQGAVTAGAVAANYVKAVGFHKPEKRISGVRVRDMLGGREFGIATRIVINAAGPWINEVLALVNDQALTGTNGLALSMNFVLGRPLLPHCAAGLRFHRASGESQRLLFLMPWRGLTLAGTYYRAHKGPADSMAVTGQDVDIFLSDLNHAYPAAGIKRDDITGILAGLLPVKQVLPADQEPDLANHFSIIDHAKQDQIDGLITVVGVKYTTARDVAARTLPQVLLKLGRPVRTSGTETQLLPGGEIPDFRAYLDRMKAATPGIASEVVEHLVYNYGSETPSVLDLGKHEPALLAPLHTSTPVIGAEIIHAVHREMAVTLSDVVFRRTDLGSGGLPPVAALEACSHLMARECGWDESHRNAELASVMASPFFGTFPWQH